MVRPSLLIALAAAALAVVTWSFLAPEAPLQATARNGATQPQNDAAHQAVGMLQYIVGDYPMAVSPSATVLDDEEFEEQIEVLETVEALLQAAVEQTPTAEATALLGELQDLATQVSAVTAPAVVAAQTVALRQRIIDVFALQTAPQHLPSLVRGRQVFVEACVACHGDQGRAQTETATWMTPQPADLQEERLETTLSAYQVFNLVSYGVPGTGMPAYPTLTPSERWDVAFYVMALGHDVSEHSGASQGGAPQSAGRGPSFDLTLLARSTDAQLQEILRQQPDADTSLEERLARLRQLLASPPMLP